MAHTVLIVADRLERRRHITPFWAVRGLRFNDRRRGRVLGQPEARLRQTPSVYAPLITFHSVAICERISASVALVSAAPASKL